MRDTPSNPRSSDNAARPRRRAGLMFLFMLGGVAFAGYLAWLKLEQAANTITGPVVIVTVLSGAVAAFLLQLRNMSASEILEVAWEAVLLAFGAIGAVLRGIWHWFLGLIGLD
jgi:hypothetical protein